MTIKRIVACAAVMALFALAGCGKAPEKASEGSKRPEATPGAQATAPTPKNATPGTPAAETGTSPAAESARTTGQSQDKQGQVAASAPAVPVYPGAKPIAIKAGPEQAKALKASGVLRYSTPATHQQVVKWYEPRMKGGLMRTVPDKDVQKTAMMLANRKSSTIQQVFIETKGKQTIITAVSKKVPLKTLDEFQSFVKGAPKRPGQGPGPGPGGPPKLPESMKIDNNKDRALAKVAMPVYKGASVKQGAVLTDKRAPGVEQAMVQTSTSAKPADVIAWYKRELASKSPKEVKGPNGAIGLIYSDKSGYTYRVLPMETKEGTIVMLTRMKLPERPRGGPGGPPPGAPPPPNGPGPR